MPSLVTFPSETTANEACLPERCSALHREGEPIPYPWPSRINHARPHVATQSDDLYDLVSDRAIAAKPLILTSNRAPKDWYPLFPNPVVAESLLDRLINTSHQVLMDGPSYRPRKRPGTKTT
jgi:hypothetical protein